MVDECGLNVFITRNLFEKKGEADQLKFEQAIPLKKWSYELQTYMQCANNYISLHQYHENLLCGSRKNKAPKYVPIII